MTIKLTKLDLNYILTQIDMSFAGQFPANPILSFGLRQIAGTNNNLAAGQSTFGSSNVVFPSLTDQIFQAAQFGTNYAQTSGVVVDSAPRTISLLIASQNAVVSAGADGILGTVDDTFVSGNKAAFTSQQRALSFLGQGYQNLTLPGADGIYGTADDTGTTFTGLDGVLGATAFTATAADGHSAAIGAATDLITADGIKGTRAEMVDTATSVLHTINGVLSDDIITKGDLATPTKASESGQTGLGQPQSLFIPNVTPDNGLSAPYNSFFTFFGQFFDHGLDKITTNAVNGTIFIPLNPDDPLYNPNSPGTNFMVETRAQDLPGPDGILGTADDVHQYINQDTPFVDQSQTYGSDPSHDAFLRAYMIGADGKIHSTGALLTGTVTTDADTGKTHDNMADWAQLKANAAFLGLKITDLDVGNVPVLNVDAYGNLIFGPHGFAEFAVTFSDHTTGFVEGNKAATIGTTGLDPVTGKTYAAVLTGDAFINDMAQGASPFAASTGAPLPVSAPGVTVGIDPVTGDNLSYDPSLLAVHYVAGDGRVNENIGLTAIQNVFHAEHDRILAQIEATIQTNLNNGDIAFATPWVLPGTVLAGPVLNPVTGAIITPATQIAANQWNGEVLFQAAKFATETEYQHIVFEEFARTVAPSIHPAGAINVNIDPAIVSEFANVVYRFGHSMLDENLNLYVLGADGKPVIDPTTGQPQMTEDGLIQAFTNPTLFANGVGTVGSAGSVGTSFNGNMTADIILGTVNQVGNEIDQFVTGSLQNNLLGLPLDLASLNIARGRDTGVAPLNLARAQLFAQSGETQLKPYTSWNDFRGELKDANALVNFIAAYGTHASLTAIGETNAQKLAAANTLVSLGTLGQGFNGSAQSQDAYNFLNSLGIYANLSGTAAQNDARTAHDSTGAEDVWSTGSVTGLDQIDMWIGGLAEKQSLFGGLLGSTFEYVFRTQMEALQDGDRLYYLSRIEGTDYEESLQNSSLSQLIMANTDIKLLPANIFTTPEYTIDATNYYVKNADGTVKLDANNNPTFLTNSDGTLDTSNWLRNPTTGALMVNVENLPTTDPVTGKITFANTLVFGGDNNFTGNEIVLGGTAGNDHLTAGASDGDTVYGFAGNDVLDGGGGADFLFGGDNNDILYGGQGADEMHGDAGDDTLYGGDGIDTMFGGDGNDYMEGGRGDDSMLGGLGNDIIIGNEGFNTLIGNEGDDWLQSSGGQGDLMFGDSGSPTGQQPLYSGNDVMVGGIAGGDIMKGFSGDDIMLGHGSFTKFIGGLGFDWGSYELATQGVDEDMNRKEFVAANGAVDNIRDVWQATEGASGSAFDDIILGDNATRLLTTKDELDNIPLIQGLNTFFDPGIVSFDGGNILLGGAGNDTLIGGGGNDILDGDAWLHVGLTTYSAGGQIIRQIFQDPNGNTYQGMQPFQLTTDAKTGLINNFVAGTGNVNAQNVDTAVYNGPLTNYSISGPDGEGFLTIAQLGPNPAVVGGNPQGLLGGNDDTDRIRHIERLVFADQTIAIDSSGQEITSSLIHITGATNIANYELVYGKYYDAVPFGAPTMTETDPLGNTVDPTLAVVLGNTMHGSISLLTDLDNLMDANGNVIAGATDVVTEAQAHYQWQYNDLLTGQWLDYAGATTNSLLINQFLVNSSVGVRLKVSYVDGKGYTEQVFSPKSFNVLTVPGGTNTAPFLTAGTQFNGIANTTAQFGGTLDFFSPFTSIFNDLNPAVTPDLLVYTATLADGQSLASAGLQFKTVPGILPPAEAVGVSLAGEFSTLPGFTFDTVGQIVVRVVATDPVTHLSTVSVFTINVLPPDNPPVAVNDSYSVLKSVAFTALASQSVLRNDVDPGANPFTAKLVTGPAHGTLVFNPDGTFVYTSNTNILAPSTDSFTYQDTDSALLTSDVATVTLNIAAFDVPPVVSPLDESTTTLEDASHNGTLLPGTDIDGPLPLSFKIVAGSATNGTVTLVDALGNPVASNTTGAYVFTPTPNYGTNTVGSPISDALFGGPGTFQYVVTDGATPGFPSGKDSQPKTVSVDVTPVDDGPGVLTLSGLLAAGQTLTATLAGDPEGVGVSPAFKWLRDGTAIAGVTSSTYTLTEADVGHKLSASANYTDGQNFATTVATGTSVTVGEVFVKPTALAAVTTVTASNNLFTSAGLAVTGATYGWETSADGITWTSAASGVTFGPGVTGVAGEFVRATASYVDNGVTVHVPSLATHYINDTAAAAGDILTGVAGTDIIFAGPGNDVITPGAGNDYVFAGTGNNTIVATVGDGNDTYNGGAGTDTYDMSGTGVLGTVGATVNLIQGTSTSADTGSDILISIENATGGSGNDTLNGNGLNNVLSGGAGNDTLNGRVNTAGGDTMIGGLGNDSYIVNNAADVVTENADVATNIDTVFAMVSYSLATTAELNSQVESLRANVGTGLTLTGNAFSKIIAGAAGNDTLTGGTSNDTITGGAGNDSLVGGGGDDSLDGGTGNDTMAGGTGNDTYFVDSATDVVTENLGEGTADTIMASVSYSLAVAAEVNSQVETLRVNTSTTTGLTLTGNAFSHTIIGGIGNDTLIGGTGNDTITGGAGNDSLTGGTGDDTLDGGTGNDTMIGGIGNDTYVVDSATDVVTENAGEGTDTIKTSLASYSLLTNGTNVENLTYTGTGSFTGTGNALANVITGGAGNDTLDDGGIGGADTLKGAAGNDTYVIRNSGDVITDTSGIDTIDTTLTTYALDAANTLDNLTFIGGNVSFNGAGNGLANILTGGAGNDTLNGGNGNDTLIGGAGADTLTGGGGNDLFNEFKGDANGDLITDFTRGSDLINFFNYAPGATLVKGAVGGGITTYSVQVGGVTQDTFKLNGNVTLAAADFRFN